MIVIIIKKKEMCLLTFQRNPYNAKQDLIVLKTLVYKDGKYKTPWVATPVQLNSMLVPEGNECVECDSQISRLSRGFIHANVMLHDLMPWPAREMGG